LLKNAAGAIASAAADNANPWAGLATKIGGKVAADVSESADIRMGRFFPDKVYVGAIDLAPGTYTVRVRFGGSVKEFKDVVVREGKVNLLQAVSLQ
jgi:hypothetical protein